MCNELLKNAFRSIFAAFAEEIYTLSCNFPRRKRRIAYKAISKGTGFIRHAAICV